MIKKQNIMGLVTSDDGHDSSLLLNYFQPARDQWYADWVFEFYTFVLSEERTWVFVAPWHVFITHFYRLLTVLKRPWDILDSITCNCCRISFGRLRICLDSKPERLRQFVTPFGDISGSVFFIFDSCRFFDEMKMTRTIFLGMNWNQSFQETRSSGVAQKRCLYASVFDSLPRFPGSQSQLSQATNNIAKSVFRSKQKHFWSTPTRSVSL